MKVIEARGMELLRCLVHRIGRSLTRIADPPMMLSCFWATIFPILRRATAYFDTYRHHSLWAQEESTDTGPARAIRRGKEKGGAWAPLALGSHASSGPSYTRSRACAITGQEAGVKQAASGYSETFLPSST